MPEIKVISPPVIAVRGVHKRFDLARNHEVEFKTRVLRLLRHGRRQRDDFWALRGVDLEVARGESVGLIGANGSGKSTLLKLISGILVADRGTVSTTGSMAAMVELGAGFHPDLSGRDNVYINASILGFSRTEIDNRFDDIVEFSGIAPFIDSPVRTYSSGMYLRLGFAVAVHLDPDILLIDEILAVGDESFTRKCLRRIEELQGAGKTLILVSHDMRSIERICRRVVLLSQGQVISDGPALEVIRDYHRRQATEGRGGSVRVRTNAMGPDNLECASPPPDEQGGNRWGSSEVVLTAVTFGDSVGAPVSSVASGEPVQIHLDYQTGQRVENPVFGISFTTESGILVAGPNTREGGLALPEIGPGTGRITFALPSLGLLPGRYLFSASVYDHSLLYAYDHREHQWLLTVVETPARSAAPGIVDLPGCWSHHGPD